MRLLSIITWLAPLSLCRDVITAAAAVRANYFQCPGIVPNPVILKGKRFFDTLNGDYFPVKGIAYYPRPNAGNLSVYNSVDFFTEDFRDLWTADIANMRKLGVNTVRIYAVDPSKNHDAFMCALQEAKIYAMIELLAQCDGCSIGPNQAPSCYSAAVKERGQYVINEFSKYANTLVFSAGNEVTLYSVNRDIALNAPCQKKFIRDMRAYVSNCSEVTATILPRKVPIGMVNWDGQRDLQTLYFNCETSDPFELPEWYGLNVYLQCDPYATNVDQITGWIQLKQNFTTYNLTIPVIVAEYGCRAPFPYPTIDGFQAQRKWLQVDALYSESYEEVFAGGVAFEYSAEKYIADQSAQKTQWPYYNFTQLQYGIGYYSPVDCDDFSIPCLYNQYPEFALLAAALGRANVSYIPGSDNYLPIYGQVPTCPSLIQSIADFVWPSDDTPDLPCYVIPTPAPTAQPTPAPHRFGGGRGSAAGRTAVALSLYLAVAILVPLGTFL